MKNTDKYSITDTPRDVSKGEQDKFGICPFENGLIKFIEHANTPMTIALQGEWGSGKTSLMNTLKNNLCGSDSAKFFGVWINTWEYSLMKDANIALIDIVSCLVDEITKITGVSTGKQVWNSIMKFSLMAGSAALNRGADVVKELIEGSNKSPISELRKEMESKINEHINKTGKQGFIFFVDDLDRIEPSVAVQLLELLKNIFNLNHCIFVLAIDYDVVIKGLEPKFGKLSEQNEREFRSFFDKIIQVPFSMPVTSYMIDDFLKESLLSIRYINENQSNKQELITMFSEISNLSVGTNPRALKRLLNSLLLIHCVNSAKDAPLLGKGAGGEVEETELELVVNFALVSIQIAFPMIYKLLTAHPGFDKWTDNIAMQMNLIPYNQQNTKQSQLETFSEEWIQTLFKLCDKDHYLKKKFSDILKLLNHLKKIIEEKNETVEDVIGDVISLSSVTNLDAFDKQPSKDDFHLSGFLKTLRDEMIQRLKKQMPELKRQIDVQGKRVKSNAFIKFSKKDGEYCVKLHAVPVENGICLTISTTALISMDKSAELTKTAQDFYLLQKSQYPQFTVYGFENNTVKKGNEQLVTPCVSLTLPSVEDFNSEDSLSNISGIIAELYRLMKNLKELCIRKN
ncbi:MAG: KAP family NTPase [Prevotellaceae bacterium]|jgi:hypothetical protein|nr:KAP family NTPase [Prevotellaceae bacterium]